MENRRVSMNRHTNLLQLEEHMYPLVDVATPNVFRNLFPYSEVPKIAFNDRVVPHHMPDDIWITDTTFRDGQQSRAPYSTEQIVRIYDYLHKLGGPEGRIRASEFFLYSKKDRDAVEKCMERGYEFPEVTSWIRANKKDFQLVRDMGMRETGILVSCSDYHIFYKMKMTRREAMNHYLSVIRECLETGISPRCHLEDITRSDIYGFVIPFCVELMKLMDEYKIPIKVRACDTMGYGVNFPGNQQGADEIVFYDITASYEGRGVMLDVVRETAKKVFVPLTVGGGIKTVDDIRDTLRAGADKVSVNSQAVQNPQLIKDGADIFGCQCICVGVDAKKVGENKWTVFINGGRVNMQLDLVDWVKQCEQLGAGEICLNSIDTDGVRGGFDLPMLKAVCDAVQIPVIASGGAGKLSDFADAFLETGCSAALAASLFHFRELTVQEVKADCRAKGIPMR